MMARSTSAITQDSIYMLASFGLVVSSLVNIKDVRTRLP